MKESIFEVLIYLFENYLATENDYLPATSEIHSELLEVGFHDLDVLKAFAWLESLGSPSEIGETTDTFRIYCDQELARLDRDCRDLLLFLENSGVLSSSQRELVIEGAMALDTEICLEKLKWIVLMVLSSQPDNEEAIAHMEGIVYELEPLYLH